MMKLKVLVLFAAVTMLSAYTMSPVIVVYSSGLPSAHFHGSVGSVYAPVPPNEIETSGSVSYDYIKCWDDTLCWSAAGTVTLTAGYAPRVDVMAESFSLECQAHGQITYYVGFGKKDPRAPNIDVPILIETRGHMWAYASSAVAGYSSDVIASVTLWWGEGIYRERLLNRSIRIRGSIDNEVTENVEFDDVFTRYLNPAYGWGKAVFMCAWGDILGAESLPYGTGGFQAVIDPIIEIDPDFLVNIDGVDTPATELYSLVFNEGFGPSGDTTLPLIENVFQQPAEDSVYPGVQVEVYATVIDYVSGVKRVTLNCTSGDGTWITVDMTNLGGNVWNATIPAFPYGTNIAYIIIAEDNVNNTITTEEMGYKYQYHVIPEFPSFIILPLFMIATLLAVIVSRRKHSA